MKNIFFNRVERRALVFSEHLMCRRNRELSADEVAESDAVLRSHPAVVQSRRYTAALGARDLFRVIFRRFLRLLFVAKRERRLL